MNKYSFIIAFFLTLLPQAGFSNSLTVGGVPVKFANWQPSKIDYKYSNFVPDKNRITEYRSSGFSQVDLLEKRSLEFLSDGKIEETVVRARYFLNSSGIETNGNERIWIDSYYQNVSILSAHTLTSSGDSFEVDPAIIQISSDSDPNIFSDNFLVSIPYPKLSPESISLLIYKIEHDVTNMPLPWSTIYYPKRFSYLENFILSMSWENADVKPEWKTDYEKLICSDLQKGIVCSAKTNSAHPDDPDIGNYRNILPQIVVAKKASWENIKNEMSAIMDGALTGDSSILKFTQELTNNTKTELEKLEKIHEFVTREIRYVGIEHGRGGIVPRLTTKTFERRFGDCKDKVALFNEMARMAGLDAYPVLATTQRKNLSKFMLPAHIYFNHVISCVKTKTGAERCFDLTDPFTDSTQLPYYMHGTVGLQLGSGGESQPIQFPTLKYTWSVQFEMNNQLLQDGSLVETFDRSYMNHYGSFFRGKLAHKTNEEKSIWFSDGYKGVMGKTENVKFDATGLDTISGPVIIHSKTKYDNTFKPDNFDQFSEFEYWLRDMMRQFKTNNQQNIYHFDGLSYVSKIKYTLPEGFSVDNVGSSYNYKYEFGGLTRHYVKSEKEVSVITEVKIPRVEVDVEKLEVFNQFLEFIAKENKIRFSVK